MKKVGADVALIIGVGFGLAAVAAQMLYRTFVLPLLIGSVMLLMMWCFSDDVPMGDDPESPSAGLETEEAADQGVVHSP